MATTVVWRPGPTSTEEYDSVVALRDAIRSHYFLRIGSDGPLGMSEVGAPPWRPETWGSVTGGQPYLSGAHYNLTSDYVQQRFRYSSALVGMVDPAVFLPYVFGSMTAVAYDDFKHAKGRGTAINGLVSHLGISGLSRSALNTVQVRELLYPTFSSRSLGLWALRFNASYAPNPSEVADGIKGYEYSTTFPCIDADDGTINLVDGMAAIGAAVDQVPQIIVQPGTQEQGWGDLVDGLSPLDRLEQSWEARLPTEDIDNWHQKIFDGWKASEEADALERPEAVTHPDDQAGDPFTPLSVFPPTQAFSTAGALPAVIAAPALLLTISKPAVLKVASVAAGGAAAASAYTSGVFNKLASMADRMTQGLFDKLVRGADAIHDLYTWATSPTAPMERIAEALENPPEPSPLTLPEEFLAKVERIAVALETLAHELSRDPDEPLLRPGLVATVEQALEVQRTMELRAKGVHVQFMQGYGDQP